MRTLATVDFTRWRVVEKGWLTPTGCNEIVAAFVWKGDAEKHARRVYGRRWRERVEITRREEKS